MRILGQAPEYQFVGDSIFMLMGIKKSFGAFCDLTPAQLNLFSDFNHFPFFTSILG